MTEGTPLDDLLNDAPEVVEATPEAAEPGIARDESGRFAAKETGVQAAEPTGEAQPVPPTDQLPPETFKAVKEEREKRQNLERELEALKNQFQQLTQEPPAPPPSVWEDENAWGGHLVNTAVQQATFNAKLDMSEMMVRQANPDFEEVKAEFLALAEQNPTLGQQALSDPHPWNKAYQIAKSHRAMRDLGATDVNDLREKLKAEVLAELQGATPAKPGLPISLSGERSVATRGGPQWTGPTSLSDILSR